MRMLIVDDHPLFVDAIRPYLERLGATEVLVAHTGADAIAMVRSEPVDAALVDIGLPDRSGLSVGREIHDIAPQTRLVALTAVKDASVASQALALGFLAFVPKDASLDEFERTMSSVLGGEVVPPSRLLTRGSRNGHGNGNGMRPGDHLTPREREVLTMLVDGASGRRIAEELSISGNTVRTHIQSILTKLQVHSRLEAAAYAAEAGLVDVGGGRNGGGPTFDGRRSA
jgi:two-component system nitrate/nitrite response regulator NarL